MQGYLDKTVDKKTQGIIDELLVNIKKIQKIIKKVKFQTCTILVVLKSLYGTLKTSQLFWENLSGILNEWNLKTIPYAWFTAKKNTNVKQCTILWHVNDRNICQKGPNVVDSII